MNRIKALFDWIRKFTGRSPEYKFNELAKLAKQNPRETLRALILKPKRLLVILLIGAVVTCIMVFKTRTGNQLDTSMLVPTVRVQVLQPQTLVHEVRVPGTITFLEKASVTSKILGRVEKIFVDQGATVRKGERLAQMETLELILKKKQAEAALNSAGAQLNLARARYQASRRDVDKQIKDMERMQSDIIESKANYMNAHQNLLNKREIFDMGGISKQELKSIYAEYVSAMSRYYQSRKNFLIRTVGFRDEDLKKANETIPAQKEAKRDKFIDFNTEVDRNSVEVSAAAYKNAMLEIESANLLLKESILISPLAGVVASRAIDLGEEVKQGEPIFTVIRMDRLLISTNIPELEVPHIQTGLSASFTVDALADEKYAGKVYQISPVVDVNTRTAEIKIELENKGNRLSPGMFVRCSIATRKKEGAMALPESALFDRKQEKGQNTASVFVIQNELAFKRTAIVGARYGDRFEILSGLKAGDVVVTEGIQTLKDGAKVKIKAESKETPGQVKQ
ncbi:MAG: efflux RND transporter periplasmic adaptor subunit [Leptospirales bacterium]|nr:efflux RND transporter periplasmic adaptor subunit [Leptospirales bacterium]